MLFLQKKLGENWIKKYEKKIARGEINEIEDELNIDEIEANLFDNFIPKYNEFGESSRIDTYFMRPIYGPRCTTNFSFGIIPSKPHSLKILLLPQLAKQVKSSASMKFINREKIYQHWKKGINSVLSLTTTQIARNFLNYIEHSYFLHCS